MVCNGIRPSLYCSLLAISAPPNLPPHCTRIPSAPILIAAVIDCFIARRKEILPSICEAIDSATSDGVKLGTFDFVNEDLHLLRSDLLQLFFKLGDFLPALADDNARTGRVDGDHRALRRSIDLNSGDSSFLQTVPDIVPNHQVLLELSCEPFLVIPV